MMNKHANDITVQATVIDEDTIRYGGSAFKRERTCRPLRRSGDEFKAEEVDTTLAAICSLCGNFLGESLDVKDGSFCSDCGARVERDA